jgi:hypothetical protein
MPRTDKSVSFLTGMIIAALYVVLLVSFSRETYVIAGHNSSVASAPAVCANASSPGCSFERPVCTPSVSGGQDATCMVSIRMLRHLMSQSGKPLPSDFDAAASSDDSE